MPNGNQNITQTGNRAKIFGIELPFDRIPIPDEIYNPVKKFADDLTKSMEQIYTAPGEQLNRGLELLQDNPIAGAGQVGLGIANAGITLTGFPQAVATISSGLRNFVGKDVADSFDNIIRFPADLYSYGNINIKKGLDVALGQEEAVQPDLTKIETSNQKREEALKKQFPPQLQQQAINDAAAALIATGRKEFDSLIPLLTPEGQQQIADGITEAGQLLSYATVLGGIKGGKNLIKEKLNDTQNQQRISNAKREGQGIEQTQPIQESGRETTQTSRVLQTQEKINKQDVTNFRILEEKKLNEAINKNQITPQEYDSRVKELRTGEAEAVKQTLQGQEIKSDLIPGLSEFAKQDLVPTFQKSVEGIKKTKDAIQKTFVPASRGESAIKTASIIREQNARLAQKRELAFQSLKKAQKDFSFRSDQQNIDFIDGIEKGQPIGNSSQIEFAKQMRTMLDDTWKEVVKRNGSESYIENYFPHLWKDPEKAAEVFAKAYGKRPLEGSKSFLKQRKIPTVKEGLALGLELENTNPVDNVLARLHDMNRYIMASDIWSEFKNQNLVKFVKLSEKPPKGYIKVNDKIANVFQYSEKEKGLVLRGGYWMPEQAGTVLNNFLSPGLKGKVGYELLRQSGNLMNQVQLGLSAFHFAFTSIDAATSRVALGIQQFTQGRPITALKNVISSPVAPITNLIKGNKLLESYYGRNPELTGIVENLLRAGGRVKMDSFYKNSSVESFWKAWRSGNIPGGIIRAPFAAIEGLSKPLMEYLVPRQKLGVFFDLAKNINEEAITKGWTKDILTQRLQEAWDSVDNRMGQMVYDNLFWNKSLKDLGMASVRSLGWNIGDIRELGGGAVDFLKQGKGLLTGKQVRMTPRMAYTIALPIVAGTLGGMIHYLYNGTPPENLKDYFYPRTGKKLDDGNDERISLPTYMKDIYAVKQDPIRTISHKTHPMINTIINMLNNEDYFGYEIRNPNAPAVKQVVQLIDYMSEQFVPFSIRNIQQRKKAGDTTGESLQSLYGITPAPKYITNTKLQNKIGELYEKRTGGNLKTFAQKQINEKKREVKNLLKEGKAQEAGNIILELAKEGNLELRDLKTLIIDNKPFDVFMFQRLPVTDKAALFQEMTKGERKKYLTGLSLESLQKLNAELEKATQ